VLGGEFAADSVVMTEVALPYKKKETSKISKRMVEYGFACITDALYFMDFIRFVLMWWKIAQNLVVCSRSQNFSSLASCLSRRLVLERRD